MSDTLRFAAQRLLARLREFEADNIDDGCFRDWFGIIEPAMAAVHASFEEPPLRPMATAPKDHSRILARFRCDLVEFTGRADLARWAALFFVASHPGLAADGFDIGWGFAAPVGMGGFPDEWLAGWMPLPEPSSAVLHAKGAE